MFIDKIHMPKIKRAAGGQKGLASRILAACVAGPLNLAGCSGVAVIESSATAVTIRYSAADGIDEAILIAQKTCALHNKTARLRNSANFGLADRYAHFDCL
jgi:hypothetical protein